MLNAFRFRNDNNQKLWLRALAIAALLVLCSSSAQAQDKTAADKERAERRDKVNLLIAHFEQQRAILADLLETDAKCMRDIETGRELLPST